MSKQKLITTSFIIISLILAIVTAFMAFKLYQTSKKPQPTPRPIPSPITKEKEEAPEVYQQQPTGPCELGFTITQTQTSPSPSPSVSPSPSPSISPSPGTSPSPSPSVSPSPSSSPSPSVSPSPSPSPSVSPSPPACITCTYLYYYEFNGNPYNGETMEVGDSISFFCQDGSFSGFDPTEISVNFQYSIGGGSFTPLNSTGNIEYVNGYWRGYSQPLPINQAAEYVVQCQVCKGGVCTPWGEEGDCIY